MQEVGAEGAAVLLQTPHRRDDRRDQRVHVALGAQPVALVAVTRDAGGDDVLPGRPAAARARHDMIEGQLLGRVAGATGKAEGAMDAGNMLKPALARGELHCVGATTLDEYRKYVEKDAALERRFQKVLVDEPSVEDTIAILRGLKERYEVHHGVQITDPAIVAAATLSHRYISDRQLPDKAIDLIDEAASRIRMEIDSKPEAMDRLERRLIQLKIECEALKKESDDASRKRLTSCGKKSTRWNVYREPTLYCATKRITHGCNRT